MAGFIHELNERVARSAFGRYFLLEGSGHPNARKGARFTTEIRGGLTTFSSMVDPAPMRPRICSDIPDFIGVHHFRERHHHLANWWHLRL